MPDFFGIPSLFRSIGELLNDFCRRMSRGDNEAINVMSGM